VDRTPTLRRGLGSNWVRGSGVSRSLLAGVLVLMCIAAVACSSSRMRQDITSSMRPEARAATNARGEYDKFRYPLNDLNGRVNFNDDVLPIFLEHCAECHGDDDPDEGLVLTSYDDVMAGSIYGSVIIPNDVEGSYLVEQVVSGQMPKRADDLSPDAINTIIAWVEAGAPEGAEDNNGDSGEDSVEDVAAVTPETVSFQEHVLPLLIEYCAECHGDNDPEEGLVLTSYRDVMLGSFYGSVIEPNDVAGSYLMELVESGQMPKRGEDLNQAQIDVLIAWIEAGAPDN